MGVRLVSIAAIPNADDLVTTTKSKLAEEGFSNYFEPGVLAKLFFERRSRLSKGVDRIDSDSFFRQHGEQVGIASKKCIAGSYVFSPYLELLVSKGKGKAPRIIARPTIRDKIVLTSLKNFLHDCLPEDVPRKLPNQVVRELITSLQLHNEATIVRGDISAFYDSISHKKLGQRLNATLGKGVANDLVMRSVGTPIVADGHRRRGLSKLRNVRGVPQGLPVSNFLAHLMLVKFDESTKKDVLTFHRYVDDMIFVIEKDSEDVLKKAKKRLSGIGLKFNIDKTQQFEYQDPFDFLGYRFESGQCAPRPSSVDRFIKSIAGLFSGLRKRHLPGKRLPSESWTDEEIAKVFIEELNEKLTGAVSEKKQYGWVFYFNESTEFDAFYRIDSIVKMFSKTSSILKSVNTAPIKSVVRAYFESKYSKQSGYIRNYDSIATHEDRIDFLVKLGYVRPLEAEKLTPAEAESKFSTVKSARLARLEGDIGLIS